MSRDSFLVAFAASVCIWLLVPATGLGSPWVEGDPAHGTLSPPLQTLQRQLGDEARLQESAATGTAWNVLRTDRALTPATKRAATDVALDFIRRHRAAFKLSDAQLHALDAPQITISPNGTRHLRWRQYHRGLPVSGADLRAHVAADGRLLSVQGGPLPTLATGNRHEGLRQDRAGSRPVILATPDGPRPIREVIRHGGPGSEAKVVMVDPKSGAVLRRRSLSHDIGGFARVWDARPGEPRELIEMPPRWVSPSVTGLRGDFAHVVLGHLGPEEDVEVEPTGLLNGAPYWDEPHELITVGHDPDTSPGGGRGCSPRYPCSWSSFTPYSWEANLRHAAAQAFVFINRFHDHLAAPPIGFDRASGNFEASTPGGTDGDPIRAFVAAGAALQGGLPGVNSRNNARMSVLPDGEMSFMTLYLFGGDPDLPAIDTNSAEHAAIVYHEYGHGLTGRLVTDSRGHNAMTLIQAGALGEALSDWYALDYLEATGAVSDDPSVHGEVLIDSDLTGGRLGFRHAAIDCPVDASGPTLCPPSGGFTFAQFARIARDSEGEPDFDRHADGEIMAQTLWDLRQSLIDAHGREQGIWRARELVTEALRLLAPQPSYLDLRDGILLADLATGGHNRDLIWQVFAARGMGAGASTYTTDRYPRASFDLPRPPRDPKPPPSPPLPPDDPPPPVPSPAAGSPAVGERKKPLSKLRGRPIVPARALTRLRSPGGLTVRVQVSAPARVVAHLSVPSRTARRYRLRAPRKGNLRLATATLKRLRPGIVGRLRFRLPRGIRARLRTARALGLTITIRVVALSGDASSRRYRLTARR